MDCVRRLGAGGQGLPMVGAGGSAPREVCGFSCKAGKRGALSGGASRGSISPSFPGLASKDPLLGLGLGREMFPSSVLPPPPSGDRGGARVTVLEASAQAEPAFCCPRLECRMRSHVGFLGTKGVAPPGSNWRSLVTGKAVEQETGRAPAGSLTLSITCEFLEENVRSPQFLSCFTPVETDAQGVR